MLGVLLNYSHYDRWRTFGTDLGPNVQNTVGDKGKPLSGGGKVTHTDNHSPKI